MFESIFSSTATENAIDISSAVLTLCVALIFGLIIGITYMYACKKDGYNKDYIVGLVLLPAIVSVVILLIGSNVARAFSMAGAFALVRFRSAPGSARDISVVFFAMATGLACGLGYLTFAAVFVIIIVLLLVTLSVTNFANQHANMKQLRITIPENLNYTDVFDDIFVQYLAKKELKRVKTTNMGTMFELTYYVNLKKDVNEKDFIDAIRVKNGNLNILLGMIDTNSTQLN
jgi:hypothetical protein